MNWTCVLALSLVGLVGLLIYANSENRRMDDYVYACRAQGGWAVEVKWPDHRGWIQCAKIEAISLPVDHGAKP